MSRMTAFVSAVTMVLMLGAAPASATPLIDFEMGSAVGGTITVSGGVITGTNIVFSTMKFCTDGLNPATCTFYDTSGTGASLDGNGSAVLNFQTGGSGSLTLVGGIPTLGVTNQTLASFSPVGGFTSASLTTVGILALFTATGIDSKSAALITALGLSPSLALLPWEFANLAIGITNFNGGIGLVASADFANTPVPEPGSLVLLGFGLAGLGAAVRRRYRKA